MQKLRKTTKNLSRDSQSLSIDSHEAPTEYNSKADLGREFKHSDCNDDIKAPVW
jgi:hypothetical protein